MTTNSNSTYWERLKQERQRLGLTQAEFASIGSVSKASQVGYEAGARPPTLDYAIRLVEAKVDVMFIMTGQRLTDTASDLFDWESHDAVLEAIESWLTEAKLVLPFPKKMELLRLFMEQFANENTVDVKLINRTLRVVA